MAATLVNAPRGRNGRGRATMENDECMPVSVSRRIEASAAAIFKLLADPDRDPEFDGSGMLRPGASNRVIVGVGDVFVTKMYFTAMGDYEMHNRIVVYEADRSIGWEPGNAELARNGSRWRFDFTPDGPDATLVTETYDCTDSPESVREAVDNGHAWLAGMTKTLERLDQLSRADARGLHRADVVNGSLIGSTNPKGAQRESPKSRAHLARRQIRWAAKIA
jgi:uncharacterized protein YndB with AHSA1/START domain